MEGKEQGEEVPDACWVYLIGRSRKDWYQVGGDVEEKAFHELHRTTSYPEGCDKPTACGSLANPDRKVTF